NVTGLTKVLLTCAAKWDNLRVFDFPYLGYYRDPVWIMRAVELAKALGRSQSIRTILLPQLFQIPSYLSHLRDIPSLQVLQFKTRPHVYVTRYCDNDPRLKALACYPPEPTEPPQNPNIPDIAPSLNPSFVPLASASQDTRDAILDRVFFFAMHVEARQPTHGQPKPESNGSRLVIPLVSKEFNRLALRHLYERPNVHSYGSASLLAAHLSTHSDLGAFIKHIDLGLSYPQDRRTIISYATNLQHLESTSGSLEFYQLLGCTAGRSLERAAFRFEEGKIPASLLANFTALRELSLSAPWTTFEQPDTIFAVDNLHTLCIEARHSGLSLLRALSGVRLPALRTLRVKLQYSVGSDIDSSVAKFFAAHGSALTHLSIPFDHVLLPDWKLFDVCRALVEVKFDHIMFVDDATLTSEVLTCVTPHTGLVKMILFSNIIKDPDDLDPALFPALREVQIADCSWPTTERAIAKSEVVPLAEAWLKQGINLTDSAGQHWVPRVKRARGR
ncbi:hypothetical protein C8R46DRAFT_1074799, partial [Mycena filopes]